MRFASCAHAGRTFAAAIVDDTAVPLAGISELGSQTPSSVLADPPLDRARAVPLAEVTLRPVVPRPAKIVCIGLNYLDHVGETGREIPEYPVLFSKFAETLTGPRDPIALPPESSQVDYEGEMAVVIGRPGRRIAVEDALGHVAGYTIANDVTMRDFQYKTHQWLQGKVWEASTPLGPWLVTPDQTGDASTLDISLTLNDAVLQQANTAQLMFDVPTLISRISQLVTLMPGDVILTGTPGGVGFRRDPQVFLAPGDRVRVEVSGLGALDNAVVAEA
jgi:acylpyruvate hydrolase